MLVTMITIIATACVTLAGTFVGAQGALICCRQLDLDLMEPCTALHCHCLASCAFGINMLPPKPQPQAAGHRGSPLPADCATCTDITATQGVSCQQERAVSSWQSWPACWGPTWQTVHHMLSLEAVQAPWPSRSAMRCLLYVRQLHRSCLCCRQAGAVPC